MLNSLLSLNYSDFFPDFHLVLLHCARHTCTRQVVWWMPKSRNRARAPLSPIFWNFQNLRFEVSENGTKILDVDNVKLRQYGKKTNMK